MSTGKRGTPDGTDGAGFLGRWSRLKRAGDEAAPDPQTGAAPQPAPAPMPAPAPEPAPEPALSAEEIAALPPIDEITAGSDISAFLRAGVPRDLRNAALRRVWMLTPAIRDYSDPAVDYAWDWNTPGGVPGDGLGPLPEKAAEMLRSLGRPRSESAPESASRSIGDDADAASERPDAVRPDSAAAARTPAHDAPDQEAATPASEHAGTAQADGDRPAPRPDDAKHATVAGRSDDELPPRRHGSALPG